MAYKALYRKYRPTNFDEVMGQKYIIQTLKNSIVNNKVGHAYIFSGPRGIGKTTIARILAKAVNCNNTVDGNPCNEDNCEVCKSINEGSAIDVIEIDAASNNGVDEMRSLLEKVNFLPANFKYKIYIIDEVHMLSMSAFNALLKTLEEPPLHVIFILATTEPHKVPATILSRCQRFDFKPLNIYEIKEQLQKIRTLEGINITDEALEVIADAAEGGMRDALSILDQVSAYVSEEITAEDVNNITGRVATKDLLTLVKKISEGKASEALDAVNNILNTGKEVNVLVQSLLGICRDIILFQNVKSLEGSTLVNYPEFIELTESVKKNKLFKYVDILNDIQNKIKYTNTPKIYLEVGVVKMISNEAQPQVVQTTNAEVDLQEVYDKIYQLEYALKNQNNKPNEDFGEFKDFAKSKLEFLEEMISKCVVSPKDLEERIEVLEDAVEEQLEQKDTNTLLSRIEALEAKAGIEVAEAEPKEYVELHQHNLLIERVNKLETELLSKEPVQVIQEAYQNTSNNELQERLDNIEKMFNDNVTNVLDKRYDELNNRLIVVENKPVQQAVSEEPNLFSVAQSDNAYVEQALDDIRLQLEAYQNTFLTINEFNEKLATLEYKPSESNNNASVDLSDIYIRLEAMQQELNKMATAPTKEAEFVPSLLGEKEVNAPDTYAFENDDFFNTVDDSYRSSEETEQERENYVALFTKVNDLQKDVEAQKNELQENIAAVIDIKKQIEELSTTSINDKVLEEIESKISNVKEYTIKVGARLTALEENIKNAKAEPERPVIAPRPQPITTPLREEQKELKQIVVPQEEKETLPEGQVDDTARAYDIKIIENILHQSRDRKNMDDKEKINSVWNRLTSLVPKELSGVANTLSEGKVVVNGANYLIIVYQNAKVCNYLMGSQNHYNAKQVIRTTLQRDYDFIALPMNTWVEKSTEYKGQYHMGIKYPKLSPINNPELKVINIVNKDSFQTTSSQNYDKAKELFGSSLIREVK